MAARKQMGRAKALLGKGASRATGAGADLVHGRAASAKVRFASAAAPACAWALRGLARSI